MKKCVKLVIGKKGFGYRVQQSIRLYPEDGGNHFPRNISKLQHFDKAPQTKGYSSIPAKRTDTCTEFYCSCYQGNTTHRAIFL